MNTKQTTQKKVSLDPKLKTQFEEEGYVILRSVIAPQYVEGAKQAMKGIVDQHAKQLVAAGKIQDKLENEPFETRLYQLYKDHMSDAPLSISMEELHLPPMYHYYSNPDVLSLVEDILGSEVRIYPNYHGRPKLPDHAGSLVLWHQDGAYTEMNENREGGSVKDLRMVNVWSPLVSATEVNGCMQFVPKTHRLGVVEHVRKEFYLEIAPQELEPRLKDAVSMELEPGDIVLFHNLLFHCGLPNKTQTVRWSFDWRYQDARMSTLREAQGHLVRSIDSPDKVVSSPQDWGNRRFE